MGLLDLIGHKYPFTDFHELNLDWCISAILQLQKYIEEFTAGNKLVFAEPLQHDLSKTYAKNTIVLDDDGNAYLSLQPVPKGVQLSDGDYWLMVFNFEDYTEKANKNFTDNYFINTTRAPYALEIDDWVVLDDVLYEVTADIPADGLFEIGVNIVHFTVEQFLKDFIASVIQIINQYKNDIDASELLYRQQLAQDIADTTASLQSQLDLAISGATVDSEVINARLGANGVTYSTLGNAVRTQFSEHSGVLQSISETTRTLEFNTPYTIGDDDPIDIEDESGNILAKIDKWGSFHCHDFNSYKAAYQNMLYTLKKYNWAVCDDNANIVFGIKDQKAIINSKLYGKNISILGDSISTYNGYIPSGYAYYYPTGNVDDVNKTWWKEVIDFCGLNLLTNASWSGSRVTGDSQGTAAAGCSTARINDLKGPNNEAPDIIFVYISTNDWANSVALGEFTDHDAIPSEGVIDNISDAYALMLYKIRTTYPKAIIYCITNLEGRRAPGDTSYPIENANGVTIHDVNHAITEIAHIFGAKIIDLNTCGIHFWNVASYTTDGTLHPNVNGMIAIKNAVIDTLLSTYNNIL